MTTTELPEAVRFKLPYRAHPCRPDDNQAHAIEWAIEAAVRLYIDFDYADAFDLILVHRPALTHSELWEAVERLCHLSEQVMVCDRIDGSREPYERAIVTYGEFLRHFAHPLIGEDAIAIVASPSPVDELAARRVNP